MSKIRVYKLADELGIKSKELVLKLKGQGIEVKNHMSAVDQETAELVKKVLFPEEEIVSSLSESAVEQESQKEESKKEVKEDVAAIQTEPVPESKKKLRISELITVKQFSEKLNFPPEDIIKKLLENNIITTLNQTLSSEIVTMLAGELGYEVEIVPLGKEEEVIAETKKEVGKYVNRLAVVTVMGHVDHGKTSLLDAIRKTKVTDQEAGGITQHIGAYEVELEKGKIVFLDTPGHESFTAMRARGAKVTDIVVLVVAAEDGVMPQTIEAIDHARAAKVPIIVAINKIDKPGANPERVKQSLSKYNLVPEEWGGDTIYVEVSAKNRIGIDELLEMILLQAEMLELKANPDLSAQGVVIEAKLDKGRGIVATVLIQNGTVKVGDPYIVGVHFGRVRALINARQEKLAKVGPSTPIEILGLSGLPCAGDYFMVVSDEKKARQISSLRLIKQREEELHSSAKITLEGLHKQINEGKINELNLVLKADVQGSLQPLREALEELSREEIKVRVIHAAVGSITETDVLLAAASEAILISFNLRPSENIIKLAKKEKIDLRVYTIIYELVSDIKSALEGLLEPKISERVLGRVEVRKVFNLPRIGVVAGCYVTEGIISRNAQMRLIRDNKSIYTGKISSLRRFKDDVREVFMGFECGIGIEKYQDLKPGDIMEAFVLEEVGPGRQ